MHLTLYKRATLDASETVYGDPPLHPEPAIRPSAHRLLASTYRCINRRCRAVDSEFDAMDIADARIATGRPVYTPCCQDIAKYVGPVEFLADCPHCRAT